MKALGKLLGLAVVLATVGCTPGGGGPPSACILDEISGAVVLSSDQCPFYTVRQVLVVGTGDELMLEPGTELRFDQDTGLEVHDYGKLIAIGTAAEPIVLTGKEAIRGYWYGLYFTDAGSFDNELRYVTVEYGGGYDYSGQGGANLTMTGSFPTRAKISHCTFRQSAGYGFVWGDDALIGADSIPDGDFADNFSTENALGPGLVWENVVGFLGNGGYTGNDEDYLKVIAGYGNDVSQTWQALDVPYLIDGVLDVNPITLTLSPGVRLIFTQDGGIEVGGAGALIAVGAATEPITFTALQPVRGYWQGLHFHDAASFDNRLEHVIIEYGGGYTFPWGGRANIVIDDSTSGTADIVSRVLVRNATIRHSDGYGIWVSDNGEATDRSNVIYANNRLGNYFKEP